MIHSRHLLATIFFLIIPICHGSQTNIKVSTKEWWGIISNLPEFTLITSIPLLDQSIKTPDRKRITNSFFRRRVNIITNHLQWCYHAFVNSYIMSNRDILLNISTSLVAFFYRTFFYILHLDMTPKHLSPASALQQCTSKKEGGNTVELVNSASRRTPRNKVTNTKQEGRASRNPDNTTNNQALTGQDYKTPTTNTVVFFHDNSDTDSSSGSGSSTSSSESEYDEETGYWTLLSDNEGEHQRSFRPAFVKYNGETPVVQKSRLSLWNRAGTKKPARRLKTPYPLYSFTNDEPYGSNPVESWITPFPPLKNISSSKYLPPLACKKCSTVVPADEQLYHNRNHLNDYLISLDEQKEYSQTCPWCDDNISLFNLGYHLHDNHPELFFGLEEKTSKLEVIELFCGIGGLSLGLQQAGLSIRTGFDLDESCRQTYSVNHGTKFIQGDIYQLKDEMLETLEHNFSTDAIRVLVAGVPCVTYSSLSQKKHSGSAKFGTLWEFGRVIKKLKPDLFLMENVPNISSLLSTGYYKFIQEMRDEGYYLSQKVLLSSEYGTPQHRKRLILLASRYGYLKHPRPKNSIDEAPTLKDAIAYLPQIGTAEQHSHDPMHITANLENKTIRAICYSPVGYRSGHLQWPSKVRYPELENKENPKLLNWRMWRHNIYGRMEYDEPAHTITTNAYHPGGGPYTHPDPKQHRGLSIRELMNIQGFPKNMMLMYESNNRRHKLHHFPALKAAQHVGNAVPPPFGKSCWRSFCQA